MGTSYTCILYHVIYSTKERRPFITSDIRERLYEYLGGAIRGEGGLLYEIGGMSDHVHLFFRWRADAALADLVRNVKRNSTVWVKKTWPDMREFCWQEGYGAFSVSASSRARVEKYIREQEAHHATRSFREEYLSFLRRHGVEYDPQYIFD